MTSPSGMNAYHCPSLAVPIQAFTAPGTTRSGLLRRNRRRLCRCGSCPASFILILGAKTFRHRPCLEEHKGFSYVSQLYYDWPRSVAHTQNGKNPFSASVRVSIDLWATFARPVGACKVSGAAESSVSASRCLNNSWVRIADVFFARVPVADPRTLARRGFLMLSRRLTSKFGGKR
jgi:hypothetical protein